MSMENRDEESWVVKIVVCSGWYFDHLCTLLNILVPSSCCSPCRCDQHHLQFDRLGASATREQLASGSYCIRLMPQHENLEPIEHPFRCNPEMCGQNYCGTPLTNAGQSNGIRTPLCSLGGSSGVHLIRLLRISCTVYDFPFFPVPVLLWAHHPNDMLSCKLRDIRVVMSEAYFLGKHRLKHWFYPSPSLFLVEPTQNSKWDKNVTTTMFKADSDSVWPHTFSSMYSFP